MRAHNIPFSVLTKKIKLNYPKSAAMGLFSNELKNGFETAMVNEPSVFESLKFYCICFSYNLECITFSFISLM